MSPLNVHVTRYPISGKVILSKYHPGRYLVAWHPKSSTKNERTSIVVENEFFERLEPPSEDEEDMLDLAAGLSLTSRLGCQITLTEELDGIILRVPKSSRNVLLG